MDSKQWRELAVQTYERAAAVDHDAPGSLVAVELYARAGAEAAIATAFAVGGAVPVPKTKRATGIDQAQTTVTHHERKQQ